MSALEIHQIAVLSDNYVYLIHDPQSKQTAVVDPAVSAPVLDALHDKGWKLTYILNTHHHNDHIGGNLDLKSQTGCQIVGAKNDRHRIDGIDMEIEDGDIFKLGDREAVVMEVPGHTSGHIAYWFKQDGALFCGDTLFALGCGRVFEGTMDQMWQSLQKIMALPKQTEIYCAHEYTQSNGAFALSVDPDNQALQSRMTRVNRMRAEGVPTVPSTLELELETNPFLRPADKELQKHLHLEGASPVQVFSEIRQRKDHF